MNQHVSPHLTVSSCLPGWPRTGGEAASLPGRAGGGGGVRDERGDQPGHQLHYGGRAHDREEGGRGGGQRHAPGLSLPRHWAPVRHAHSHAHTRDQGQSQQRGQDQRTGDTSTCFLKCYFILDTFIEPYRLSFLIYRRRQRSWKVIRTMPTTYTFLNFNLKRYVSIIFIWNPLLWEVNIKVLKLNWMEWSSVQSNLIAENI